MRHVSDLLPDYVLETLEPEQFAEVKAHLETCAPCRSELYKLNEALVTMTEALPAVTPPEAAWAGIQARLERPEVKRKGASQKVGGVQPWRAWREWALAACLLLAAFAAWWGYGQYREYQQVRAVQATVARWLSHPDAKVVALPVQQGQPLGSVIILPGGRALFVLRQAPPRSKAYQAWGHANGHIISLAVSKKPVFEVRTRGYQSLYLSLEPAGGSPQPTHPLGIVAL